MGQKLAKSNEATGQLRVPKPLETGSYSEAVLRMPKKPAIELVDSRLLGNHSLFGFLTTICLSFAATLWTLLCTSVFSVGLLVAAAMLSALAITFLVLAIIAWCRMRMKKYNIEVPLSEFGDLSKYVRSIYLGHSE